ARAILGGAAVYIAISNWTRDLALTVLGELGLDGHGQRLRVVHLGTDPEHFRPGVEATAMRVRLGIANGGGGGGEGGEGRWGGTGARLGEHKGIGTVRAGRAGIAGGAQDRRGGARGAGRARETRRRQARRAGGRRWSRRCAGCSTAPRWRGGSAPRGAARSRPTTTGIASSATSAPSKLKWWGRGRPLPPSPS